MSDQEEEDRDLPTPPPIDRFHANKEDPIEVVGDEPQIDAADNLLESVLSTAENRAQVEEEAFQPEEMEMPAEVTLEEADKANAIRSLGLGEPDVQLLAVDDNGPGIVRPQVAQYLHDHDARVKAQARDPDMMKLKGWLLN
jgi:hypothetical protein